MSGEISQNFDAKTENYHGNEVVTVKFRTDTNETLTQAFDLNTDIGALRSHLHRTLNTDPNLIVIERDEAGGEVSRLPRDGQTLKELGATSLGIFELRLRGDGIQLPKPPVYYLPAVDVITVDVNHRRLVVEIERCGAVDGHRRWLGGVPGQAHRQDVLSCGRSDRSQGSSDRRARCPTDGRPDADLHRQSGGPGIEPTGVDADRRLLRQFRVHRWQVDKTEALP